MREEKMPKCLSVMYGTDDEIGRQTIYKIEQLYHKSLKM